MHSPLLRASAAAAAAALLLTLTACNGSGAKSASGSGDDAVVAYRAANGTCTGSTADGVDATAADGFLKPFLDPSSTQLVTEKLPKPIPSDTTVAYLNNGTVIAGLLQGYAKAATTTAGVRFQNVNVGATAQTINAALDSVVESKPDILLAAAVDATFFQKQLKELQAEGTTVVYVGAVNGSSFGLPDSVGGDGASKVNGQVLAASAIHFTCGTAKNFVFYNIPEFAFSQVQQTAATAYLKRVCPSCTMRSVDISITDPSPADKIVSDLQAHPDTAFFLTPGDQFQVGLAQKARLAGVENAKGIGQSSIAPNIAQIAAGKQTAGFAVDYDQYIWTALDEGFRRHEGETEVPYYGDWTKVVQSMSRVISPASAGNYTTQAGYVAETDKAAHFGPLWR